MKILDYVIDLFWVMMAIWFALYMWVWSPVWSPLIVKDILYLLTDVMDYWMILNSLVGTIRFAVWLKRDHDDKLGV